MPKRLIKSSLKKLFGVAGGLADYFSVDPTLVSRHYAFGRQPRAVQRNGQAEVAYLGYAVGSEPNVARLQVPVDDAPGVGKLQTPAGCCGDADGLLQGKAVAFGDLYHSFHVTASHELGDHVGLVLLLTQVEDGDDVGMGTQAAHGLRFPLYPGPRHVSQTFGFDEGEGNLVVQQRVLGQVDLLFAAFA